MARLARLGLANVVGWGAVFLAIIGGVVLGTALLTPGPDSEVGVGRAVETDYGTFTVVRQAEGFVPRTQGPPTMAKMMGQVGRPSLQVWVQLVNDGSEPARFSPGQVRLEVDGMPEPLPPAGSTLGDVVVPAGSVIDGQVWFDVGDVRPGSTRHLRYDAPGDGSTTVRLSATPERRDDAGHDTHGEP